MKQYPDLPTKKQTLAITREAMAFLERGNGPTCCLIGSAVHSLRLPNGIEVGLAVSGFYWDEVNSVSGSSLGGFVFSRARRYGIALSGNFQKSQGEIHEWRKMLLAWFYTVIDQGIEI